TDDLRVMSPTSYQAAPPRVRGSALYSANVLMQPFLAEIINFVKNGAYRITSSLFFAQNCLCGA
ncbi:hypothetical protein ABLU71_29030, partial [Klebsiella sp. CB_Kp198]|uniref:hypothetical protein n=1 Tax=Klebsiella sp. CB_Kp198 TaxID=3153504 RepID=UPI0032B38D82